MGLPREVIDRIPSEDAIVSLRMRENVLTKDYFFRILAREGPNNLRNFSLTAASAQNTAGTGWRQIQDSNNRYILEPEFEGYLYQCFYGVWPSYIWVYRRYPTNVDLGSLIGTRAISDAIGFVDGEVSPMLTPSAETEFWTAEGLHPSFLGYHPYTEPGSVTPRMNFFVTKFRVEYIKDPAQVEAVRHRAKPHTMGGAELLQAPEWVR